MKKNTDIWKWLMPVWLLASSCVHEELVNESSADKDSESHPYVVLRIAVPSEGTRANPMGGEEGNGREQGLPNEEKIHDLNVFFYRDPAGLDATDDCELFHSIFYNLDNPNDDANSKVSLEWKEEQQEMSGLTQKYLELTFQGSSNTISVTNLGNGINFAVVANVGKLSSQNMGQLRNNALQRAASDLNPAVADRFAMSTAFNRECSYGGVSTGSNSLRRSGMALVGTTTVERLVGRIDLWYNATENAGIDADAATGVAVNRLVYEAEGSHNKVYITNVLPVNVMQKPSSIFKKVTALGQTPAADWWTASNLATVSEYSWGGKETPNEGTPGADMPTNYVIEPTTSLKRAGGDATQAAAWFGNTSASAVKTSITNGGNGKISDYPNERRIKATGDPDYDCDWISIISYANENTHPVDCYHSDYLTGLAFRGLYQPATIYSGYDAANDALTELTVKNSIPAGGKIYRYSPSGDGEKGPSEEFALYFSSENAAKAYKNAHASENGILTPFTAVLEDGIGLGFVCFYNLWLRHFNDESIDPKGIYPMEYATVRNNIYRVAISFTGPGDPQPTMRQPDTMQSRIFVRKWNQRIEDTVLEY